jgi:hypothetical protein
MVTTEQDRVRIGAQRSQLFTERSSAAVPSGFIDSLNNEQATLTDAQMGQAEALLSSGAVQVMVPARNEKQFGAIQDVLSYLEGKAGSENILVIDADSTDGTGDYARGRDLETVAQSAVEACIDMDRVAEDFGIQLPIRAGKGRTMMAAVLYQRLIQADRLSRVRYNLMSDADITNTFGFDHASYLAWAASLYPPEMLVEVRAAQHDRNNQIVMDAMAALQSSNPIMRDYFLRMMETVWPLTGQMIKRPEVMQASVNNVGYATEIISGMSAVDYENAHPGTRRAQIEVPERCRDGANSDQKENEMMVGISNTVVTLNQYVFSQGLRLNQMRPEDYRRLNAAFRAADPLYVPTIDMKTGENMLSAIRADVFMPPVTYLIDNGYVDLGRVAKLKQSQYGGQWNGFTPENSNVRD